MWGRRAWAQGGSVARRDAEAWAGLWESWAPAPPHPAPACSCWRHPQMEALFTGGHGPSGRVRYCQPGAAGRHSSMASKDPQSAFVGSLTRPGRRGACGAPPPHVPTTGRESSCTRLPRALARSSPAQRAQKADVHPWECPEVTEGGLGVGDKLERMSPPPVLLPRAPEQEATSIGEQRTPGFGGLEAWWWGGQRTWGAEGNEGWEF